MHVVYLHEYFVTAEGSSGTRSHDFARLLVARGHRVSLLTGMSHASPLRCAPGLPWQRHGVDGIDVWVLQSDYRQQMGAARRALAWSSYAALASALLLTLPHADVVLASSTPPSVAAPALLLKWARGTPFVYELRDLWPESLAEAGLDPRSAGARGLRAWNRLSFRAASRLVTITEGFLPSLEATYGVAPARVDVIPLGADGSLFEQPHPAGATLRRDGIGPEHLLAVYAGAFGRVNRLDYLLDAARLLPQEGPVRFVLIGEGSEKPRIIERIRTENLSSVRVLDPIRKRDLAGLLQSADVGINCVGDGEQNRVAMPNKAFDYLFAGLAVLTTAPRDGGGLLERLLSEAGCGRGVDASSPARAAELLQAWAADREAVREMGRRARALAWERFDRARLVDALEATLRHAAAR
jgi:glycosyltransferase involved in cell wall biosynthesis